MWRKQFGGRENRPPRPALKAACGAAVAVLIVCIGATTARAGDNDIMSNNPSLYDELLQVIGVEAPPNPDYSERSPLVVPPTRDLPPPAADRPPAVADWPKDPDIARRTQAKVKEKPKPHPDWAISLAAPLRPDQLNDVVGGSASAAGGGGNASADYPERDIDNKMNIFSFLNPNKSKYATFTGEPARTSLTDPPPGYLTPSPDQPYGIGPDQKRYKVPTVADRATLSSGSAESQQ